MSDFKGSGNYNEEFVERLHQDGVRTNKRVQTMRDRTKKYEHVARWQEATQNPKVEEIQSLVKRKRKREQETLDDVGGKKMQSLERKEQQESHRDVAASTFREHAEPLLSARSHNVSDFRSNKNND